jgi:hypothetical protein
LYDLQTQVPRNAVVGLLFTFAEAVLSTPFFFYRVEELDGADTAKLLRIIEGLRQIRQERGFRPGRPRGRGH